MMTGWDREILILGALWAVFAAVWGRHLAALLLELRARGPGAGPVPLAHHLPLLMRVLMPLTYYPALYFHRPMFAKLCENIERRLTTAGYEDTITAQEFLALCLLVPLVWGIGLALLALSLFAASEGGVGARALALSLALLIWMVLYPRLWLKNSIIMRHRLILRALPFVMDLLTISVEAGLDFMTAIRNIIERRKQDPLVEELGRVLFEIQLGKTRRDALRNMALRVDQPDVHSLITALVQADEMGVSIGAILRIQSDQIRTKRFLRAEKLAHEAPVKMLFPLISFIFPAVFLVLLGPLIIQIFRQGI
ncbi:MAG: type II secretion system F family protein [Kiritimatiellia bacterium]|nr:type II secretion system F family protein [Lentisphaerota bacterium]